MGREPGHELLHYRLVEKIGQGAMGSVWRARDTDLDREAAVKILPDALAGDPRLLARFEQEARLLASLDHPNVASVFGVHEQGSTRFLAMELVPGEDLSARLARGAMPAEETIRVMRQVVQALEAAHARGIVHRDLKPANIRRTPDGRVKVLDFGLAKPIDVEGRDDGEHDDAAESGRDSHTPLTTAGVVLGTAPYMSPEQARGGAIDARADIWSFGCVLYECLVGARPFPGATIPDQIAAILNEEPDYDRLPAATPPALRRLLRRCLAKDAEARLHHIADARLELDEARRELAGTSTDARGERSAPSPPTGLVAAALVAGLLLGAGLLYGLLGGGRAATPPEEPRVLAGARWRVIVDWASEEHDAAISPDGEFLAFLSDREGPFHVYWGQIASGSYRRLAAGGDTRIVEARAPIRRVGFVGRGDGIWLGGGSYIALRTFTLMGEPAPNPLPPAAVNADWSADGSRVVWHVPVGGDPVSVADAACTAPLEILPSPEGHHQHYPTWSPDGAWIYLVRGTTSTRDTDLWRLRPDGSDLEQLTFDKRDVRYPAPLDDKTVLYTAEEQDGSGPWLWELDLPTGVSRRATVGATQHLSVSASRDGRRIVVVRANPKASIFQVPILPADEAPAGEERVEPYPLDAVRAWGPRLRGDTLYYLSSRGGGDGLWRHDGGTSTVIWPGRNAPLLEPAAIDPAGERVAILVREGKRVRPYVLEATGKVPRPVETEVHVRGAACWSPDGLWLAVGGERDGEMGLFKIRVEDGRSELLAPVEAINPVWAPDDSMIVFAGSQVEGLMPLLAVTPEGRPVELPRLRVYAEGERVRFLPDASGLVYVVGLMPGAQFALLDLETHESRVLTAFEDTASLRSFDVSADGSTLVFDRAHAESDIVLIERE